MSSDGHYPYTLYYGEEGDQSSREKRKNTEVQTFRAEAGLFGNFSDTEQWKLKAYYYQSLRGLPNATTLYYDYSSQHLWDKIFSSRASIKKSSAVNGCFRLRANGTGPTSIIWTQIIKELPDKVRTVIFSRNIIFLRQCCSGRWTVFLFLFQPTESLTV